MAVQFFRGLLFACFTIGLLLFPGAIAAGSWLLVVTCILVVGGYGGFLWISWQYRKEVHARARPSPTLRAIGLVLLVLGGLFLLGAILNILGSLLMLGLMALGNDANTEAYMRLVRLVLGWLIPGLFLVVAGRNLRRANRVHSTSEVQD